jgi:hypothetical protein
VGLWRRRVIVRANGVSDTSTRVWWCQGARYHIDLRIPADRPALSDAAQLAGLAGAPLAAFGAQIAFAGTTVVDGARCEWRPEIAFPRVGDELDAGLMRFDAPDRLHEAGLDGSYTEDWERVDAGPVAGLRLVAADGGAAVAYLLVAPTWLAFAHGAPALAYASGARAWSTFFIAERRSDGDNAAWTITASNAPWDEGACLFNDATEVLDNASAIAVGALLDLSPRGRWRVAVRHA